MRPTAANKAAPHKSSPPPHPTRPQEPSTPTMCPYCLPESSWTHPISCVSYCRGPHLHLHSAPNLPGLLEKLGREAPKVWEEDGVGKQVNKPSKGSWPWGSVGPLGPWYPGGLEMRLRLFVVGRLRQWWVVWMEMSDPPGLAGKEKSINLSLLSIIYE